MSWPPIGLLIRAAIDMTANSVPVRTPIFRTSEIWAIREGASETKAPEPKPKRAAKTMIGAFAAAGSQRARTMMPAKMT